MSPKPQPTNPRKWAQAKISALKERDLWNGSLSNSPWDARLAQRAVQIYKQRGGMYREKTRSKSQSSPDRRESSSSLRRWTDENWGYVRGNKKGRYLPERVRRHMPSWLKDAENKQKQMCRQHGRKYCPYLEETKRLMNKYRG